MTTPLLKLDELSTDQQDKETPHNQALRKLEGAIAGVHTEDLTFLDQTLSDEEALHNAVILCTGSPNADRTLTVPDTPKFYSVKNAFTTNQKVTVKTAAGAGIDIFPGQERIVRCDGTDVVLAVKRLHVLAFGVTQSGTTDTRWISPGGGNNSILAVRHYAIAPFAGRVWRARVTARLPPQGNKLRYTFEKNDSPQSLVAELAALATTGEDLDPSHAFTVAEGDLISVAQTMPDGAPSIQAQNLHVCALLEEE